MTSSISNNEKVVVKVLTSYICSYLESWMSSDSSNDGTITSQDSTDAFNFTVIKVAEGMEGKDRQNATDTSDTSPLRYGDFIYLSEGPVGTAVFGAWANEQYTFYSRPAKHDWSKAQWQIVTTDGSNRDLQVLLPGEPMFLKNLFYSGKSFPNHTLTPFVYMKGGDQKLYLTITNTNTPRNLMSIIPVRNLFYSDVYPGATQCQKFAFNDPALLGSNIAQAKLTYPTSLATVTGDGLWMVPNPLFLPSVPGCTPNGINFDPSQKLLVPYDDYKTCILSTNPSNPPAPTPPPAPLPSDNQPFVCGQSQSWLTPTSCPNDSGCCRTCKGLTNLQCREAIQANQPGNDDFVCGKAQPWLTPNSCPNDSGCCRTCKGLTNTQCKNIVDGVTPPPSPDSPPDTPPTKKMSTRTMLFIGAAALLVLVMFIVFAGQKKTVKSTVKK